MGSPHGRAAARTIDPWIDTLLVAVAVGTITADVVIPAGERLGAGASEYVMLTWPPLAAGALVALSVRLLITMRRPPAAAWAFAVATLLTVTGDVGFTLNHGTYSDWHFTIWAVALLVATYGLLHPSFPQLTLPGASEPEPPWRTRFAVVFLAAVAVPVILVRSLGLGLIEVFHGAAVTVVVVVILWRLARLLAQRERDVVELDSLARRERALASISRAAVTASDSETFLSQVAAETSGTLGRSCTVTDTAASAGQPETATEVAEIALDPGRRLEIAVEPHGELAEDDLRFVRAVVDVAQAALRRWEAEAHLHRAAREDGLTRLPTRAVALEALERELSPETPADRPVTVIFVDLDNLKEINDQLGHAVGDDVLVTLAERLRGLLAPGDLAGRFAGDEFVVVCPATPGDAGVALAERIVDAFRAPIHRGDVELQPRASVGVATASPGTAPSDVVEAADAAMYEAKRRGGDRVALTGPRNGSHRRPT